MLWIIGLSLCLGSCARTTSETWQDTKTCGRYMGKGFKALMGFHDTDYIAHKNPLSEKEYDSLVASNSSFAPLEISEFVPPSKEAPGDPGSAIPGIESFQTPSGQLAKLFSHIHFETDSYSVKGEQNYHLLHEIARHLIKRPDLYIFVEGHADERGASAYNLALGAKRANAVRTFLIQNGVNPDQLFTISYGKEKPYSQGHDSVAWEKNRRAQFKLYER